MIYLTTKWLTIDAQQVTLQLSGIEPFITSHNFCSGIWKDLAGQSSLAACHAVAVRCQLG